MAYADTLNALGSDVLTPPPAAMTPPTDIPGPGSAPTPRSPSAYQRTIDGINAALGQGDGSAPNGDGAPSTLTIQPGPSYGHTLAALDTMLNAPAGTRIIMGAAAPVPAGLTPRGAAQPDPDSVPPSGRLGAPSESDDAAPQPSTSSLAPTRRISDADATADTTTPAPTPGPLSNAPGDGWLSGAAKGAGTAAVKAVGNVAGFVGGLSGLEDYLMAKGQSVVTGQTVEQATADLAARRAKTEAGMSQSALGRLASASDPTKVLPSPDDVSAPILAKTGAYQPTSEVGRLAQAGTEAALSSVGPGMGAVSPGTAARALTISLARQAPAMAAAGAASQGAVDATGSPLAGLAAGLVVPAAGEAVGAGVRAGAKLVAPVAGGSSLLNAAPVVGPALQAGREAAVADKILDQSSDPAALKAWAVSPTNAPEVPNSPRTLAGSVGNDAGLYQAEKDARNVNNARPTASVTVACD